MRTKLSETQGRRYLSEECDDIHMFDPAFGVGVVLGPQADKLVQVVGTQDGPVPGQVVKVVHDDGDEQVEDEEGAHDEEGDEVRVSKVRSASLVGGPLSVVRPLITFHVWMFSTRQHDLLPGLASGGPEEHEEGLRERLEVVVPVDVAALLRSNLAKDLENIMEILIFLRNIFFDYN